MNLDAVISISIDEESLVKALIKEREGDSFEDIMNWIVTEDGESWRLAIMLIKKSGMNLMTIHIRN